MFDFWEDEELESGDPEYDESRNPCSICGEEERWCECHYCGGSGYYDEAEWEPCEACDGDGGAWLCAECDDPM